MMDIQVGEQVYLESEPRRKITICQPASSGWRHQRKKFFMVIYALNIGVEHDDSLLCETFLEEDGLNTSAKQQIAEMKVCVLARKYYNTNNIA